MVLPTPLCPRRSTLSPRSMKSREECKCSYRLRLMERGWFQSKRSRVANLPRVARRGRARRLRLSRSRRSISPSFSQTSSGPMRLLVVCSKKARKAGSDTRKPSCCNCVATSSFDIVASEVVRDHVSVRDVVAQGDEDGDGMLGGAAMLFAQDADFAGVVRAALDGFGDGFGEDVLAVKVEQFGGPGGHAADVAASLDPALEQDADVGSGGAQTTATGGRCGALLAAYDFGAMFGKLDLLAMAEGADVLGNDGGAIEQSDRAVVGNIDPEALRDDIACLTKLIQQARALEKREVESKMTKLKKVLSENRIFDDPKMKLLIFPDTKDTPTH